MKQDEARKWTDKHLKEMERKITKEYSQAKDELTEKFREYMHRQQAYISDLQNEYNEMKRIGATAEARELGKQLGIEKQKLTLRNDKYQSMIDETTTRLANVNEIAVSYLNGEMPSIYFVNYNELGKDVKDLGIRFDMIDEHTVARRIKDGDIKLPKKKINIPKDKRWNTKQLNSAVLQGILQGESMDKIANRIFPIVDNNMSSAMRNARTMTTGAENQGRQDSYSWAKSQGIILHKVWMSTPDERTRESHIEIDGETANIDEPFSNGLMYPGDPNGVPEEVYNCRCTMVTEIVGFDINKREIEEQKEISVNQIQSQIGNAKTVQDVNDLMNNQNWWKSGNALLDGCDLESAKSIASSYQQIFEKYPQLVGKFRAPDAAPVGMSNDTYAWCFIKSTGQVQVNPKKFNDWASITKQYEKDVIDKWHPQGTTAESIVVHEFGHAIDGLLAREGIKGGITANGEYRYASSNLKNVVMNKVAETDEYFSSYWNAKDWSGKPDKFFRSRIIKEYVSEYATKNNKEWFAECFAEYITSANPRIVAREFGKELEKLLRRLK